MGFSQFVFLASSGGLRQLLCLWASLEGSVAPGEAATSWLSLHKPKGAKNAAGIRSVCSSLGRLGALASGKIGCFSFPGFLLCTGEGGDGGGWEADGNQPVRLLYTYI